MSESSYSFNFSILKMSIVISLILAILNGGHVINVSIWFILLPIFVAVGLIFFGVFVIGCITLILLARGLNNSTLETPEIESESEDEE